MAASDPTSFQFEGEFITPIQVEETNGGEDYRNIVAGQLLRESDERYHPYKHHIGNEVPRLISAKTYSIIPTDYQKVDTEECIAKVTPQIQEVVDGFPCALGLCIAISSERGCESTDPVPNIHKAGDIIIRTFRDLGYATFRITNPSKIELLAVFEAVAKHVQFQKWYHRLVIYYTGHGIQNCISLHDGYINISYLKTLLWPKVAPKISEMPKVLIFDCCRGSNDRNSAPSNKAMFPMMYSLAENSAIQRAPADGRSGNTLILFSTLLTKAYAADDGIGLATAELVKLLEKPESRSLADIFQSDLYKAIKKAVECYPECVHMYPIMESTLEVCINVYSEKMEAMRPTEIKCFEDREMSRISWTPPLHATHHNLLKYMLAKRRPGLKDWNMSGIEGDATASCFDVSNRELAGYELSVVACYADSSTVYGDIFWLENIDISPWNVKVSEDGDGLTFYWRKSINGDIFKPIGFKILKKTIAGPGGWVVASDDLFAEDRHCTVIGGSFKTHRYKVVALYKDRTSVGQEAVMTDDLGVQIHKRFFPKKWRCPCLALMLLSVFIAVGITFVPLVYLVRPHFNELALASDVIDCDILPTQSSWFYSAIEVTESATDEANDNKDGFQIDVFSVKKSELKYHNFTDIRPPFVRPLGKSSNNRFIVPYDYYNRPWYMRKNSKITLNFDIQTSALKLPNKAVAYLFNGEQHVNDFIEDSSSTPHYQQKLNILDDLRSTKTFLVTDNGYHFVAVEISTDVGIDFMCNVSFNVVYIDRDDYNLTNLEHIPGVGYSITHSLDANGRNLILCFIHHLDFGSPSIHLVIDYIPGRIFAFESLILVLCILVLCGSLCHVVRLCDFHNHSHNYTRIQ